MEPMLPDTNSPGSTSSPELVSARGSVVAVGRFDGVHLGHQFLLREARRSAREWGVPAVAYTFPPTGEALLPLPAKQALLERFCDRVLVKPWPEVRHLSPEEFVSRELVGALGAKVVVVGPNHRFGHRARGDVDLLRTLGQRFSLQVRVVPPRTDATGEVISRRRIRELVRAGRVEEAGKVLGRPPMLWGERVSGVGLASKLGFPTVNLELWPGQLRPPAGVYLAWARWSGGSGAGLFYLGSRPTFPHLPPTCELHLLSSPEPEPEGLLEVALFSQLRPDMRFSGPRELGRQIQDDLRRARDFLSSLSPPAPVLVGS
jgi:riboflavin kinase/FMN adenylyltransferase